MIYIHGIYILDKTPCNSGWLLSCYTDKHDFELLILLPQPFQSWECRLGAPFPQGFLFLKNGNLIYTALRERKSLGFSVSLGILEWVGLH